MSSTHKRSLSAAALEAGKRFPIKVDKQKKNCSRVVIELPQGHHHLSKGRHARLNRQNHSIALPVGTDGWVDFNVDFEVSHALSFDGEQFTLVEIKRYIATDQIPETEAPMLHNDMEVDLNSVPLDVDIESLFK